MPRHFRVEELEFYGQNPKILGNVSFSKVTLYDDFLGYALNDKLWLASVGSGGAVAYNAAANGTVRLTTNTADNDLAELASGLNWYGQQHVYFETRIKVDNITTVGIVAGLSDAVTEANDQVAFEINATTIVDRCTDGVAWVFDTDATTDKWYTVGTSNGTQVGAITAHAPVNATYEVLGIELDGTVARYFRNGVGIATIANACRATTALTPYIAVISRAGSASRNLDIDYVKVWQDRLESSSVLV
jgi:hypothetical protein